MPSVPGVDCFNCRRVLENQTIDTVRCCDAIPFFPNFIVGEIFANGGNSALEELISQRRGDPLGIWVPPELAKFYRETRKKRGFGPPCPLLSDGLCTIYPFRPALCLPYHCYYPSPLWREMWHCLASLLETLQETASQYLASELNIDFGLTAKVCEESEDSVWEGNSIRSEIYPQLWQKWLRREKEFYILSYKKLQSIGNNILPELRLLRYQSLWNRRATLPLTQRLYLNWEYDNWESTQTPKPKKPPRFARKQWRNAETTAPPLTVHQMESALYWYIQKLKKTPQP